MINGVDDLLAAKGPDSVLGLFRQASAPEEEKVTQSQLLLQLAQEAELFHTPDGVAYGSISVGEHRENWSIKSKLFRLWLRRQYYNRYQKAPGSQAMQDALGALEAKALFDSAEEKVFTRVARQGDSIFVDLCDSQWRAVRVTAEDWEILALPPVRFRRTVGMWPLPVPTRNGSLQDLRKFLNLDDKSWILCLCWLAAAWRPEGPYPILVLQGRAGLGQDHFGKNT
jgi:hypothetical protein